MGKIVLFMGKSSSGKDTIIHKIIKENKYDLKNIVMHTTRPPRAEEIDGREYHFSTREEMLKLKAQKMIVESREYETRYGLWYYFTVCSSINLNKNNYIASNTLVGFEQYLNYYGKDNIISILINLDDGIKLQRALNREKKEKNPKYDELCRRFLSDSEDFSLKNIEKYPIDYVINNEQNIENTMEEVNKILKLHL